MKARPRKPGVPAERTQTVRAAIRRALGQGPATARALSTAVRIREKDVAEHLEHLAKSLEVSGARLLIEPARCLGCGYEFSDRKRLTTPGRCPSCDSERIEPPVFALSE